MDSTSVTPTWLPTEIWVHIFLLATSAPYTHQLYETQYHPFHNPPGENERYMLDLADRTMLALSLVCREWHWLSAKFLFENIRLSWYGSSKLLQRLQGSTTGDGLGKWVRRLELSVIEHEVADHPVSAADILRWCPNVQTLVKWGDDLLPHTATGANFTALRRFDWYYARYRDGDHQFATEDDDHSRGQDFLRDVVRNAPHLRYLSLVKRFRSNPRLTPPPSCFVLPTLTTLRVELLSSDVWAEIASWTFPQLTALLCDSSFLGLPGSLLRTWDTVQVLELLKDEGSVPSESRIPSVLKICPSLRELNYYIEFVCPPPMGRAVATSVRLIRLHFATNYDLRWLPEDPGRPWDHISSHFYMLSGPMFPCLERVVLYGPWQWISEDVGFNSLQRSLFGRGCVLEDSNGLIVAMA
ncbi:hypothetical protein B0H10DRAFT_2035261 [Mycena sp. CBHHK59/15]|nr:hypothetical protein B0H10DRAFT_2035261 [Mycena sp. CBHHK59/15]